MKEKVELQNLGAQIDVKKGRRSISLSERHDRMLGAMRKKVETMRKMYDAIENCAIDDETIGDRLDKIVQDGLIEFEEIFPENADADGILFGRLGNIKDDLMKKRKKIRTLPKGIGDLADVLEYNSDRGLVKFRPQDIVRVIRSAFSVTVVLEEDFFKREIGNNIMGVHNTGTPFNFIIKRASEQDEQGTMHHENIHNMTDGIEVLENMNPTRRLESLLRKYKDAKGKNDANAMGELLKDIGNAEPYLNDLHGEIVASYEQAEQKNFGFRRGKNSIKMNFFDYAGEFRTAGSYIIDLSNEIDKEVKRAIGDIALEGKLKELFRDLIQGFINIVDMMRKSLATAESIGGSARDEVEMLFFLLKPTQYRHITSYLGKFAR